MREISLITGQLHRAIYNLNDEARRTANQKFESGLLSAPQRSLKKAFAQFRESLEEGDSTVRRRTASLLATLTRSFDRIEPELQPEILQMISLGLGDAQPLVREATVESYSLLLENIDDQRLQHHPPGDGAADVALTRILELALSDPQEIVREAAIVSVAVQKSAAVQAFGVSFLMDQVNHHRHRRACRSVESLAEFPAHRSTYLRVLGDCLNDSDWRFRRSALKAALRLAKLESLPPVLLPNVIRRLFDCEAKVASAAQSVVQAALVAFNRDHEVMGDFLTECLWLAEQADPENHLNAILETQVVRDNLENSVRCCADRAAWLLRKRSSGGEGDSLAAKQNGGLMGDQAFDCSEQDLVNVVNHLVQLDHRAAIGWVAGMLVRLAGLESPNVNANNS